MKAIARSRLSQNTLVLLVSNGGSAVLSFLLSVLIGRTVGESGLGIYAATLAWIYPLSLVTEFGLGTLITRDIAQSPEHTETYVRIAIIARLGIGGGLMLLMWIIAPLLTDNLAVVQGLRISVPMIVLVPLFSTFAAVFRARQVMQPIAFLNLGMLIIQVIWTALIFVAGYGVQAALIVNVLTSAGQVIVAWWIYRRDFALKRFPDTHNALYADTAMGLMKQAFPFAVAAILGAIQLRLNLILLEHLAGTSVVGQYVAASRFVEAVLLLPAALYGALFPVLSEIKNDHFRLNRLLRQIQFGLGLYGVSVGLGGTLLAATIIHWTYGTAFVASIIVLQRLVWMLLPNVLKNSLTLYWYARGYENQVNIITGLVIVIQFTLGILMIRALGAIGAAMTIVLTESIALVLLYSMIFISPKQG